MTTIGTRMSAVATALQAKGMRSLPAHLRVHNSLWCSNPTSVTYVLQVDDSGKVSRLRKQCPQCGPGIFMATHFDIMHAFATYVTFVLSCRWTTPARCPA
jgi:ribosomal protein S27AE